MSLHQSQKFCFYLSCEYSVWTLVGVNWVFGGIVSVSISNHLRPKQRLKLQKSSYMNSADLAKVESIGSIGKYGDMEQQCKNHEWVLVPFPWTADIEHGVESVRAVNDTARLCYQEKWSLVPFGFTRLQFSRCLPIEWSGVCARVLPSLRQANEQQQQQISAHQEHKYTCE